MRRTGEEKTCDAHEKDQLSRFSYTYVEEGGGGDLFVRKERTHLFSVEEVRMTGKEKRIRTLDPPDFTDAVVRDFKKIMEKTCANSHSGG